MTMQPLSDLLRSLPNIQLILHEMSNRRVAFAVANRIKQASSFSSKDFVDIADLVDEGIEHADLTDADVERLRVVSKNLHNCNQRLHLVQNLILSA